MNRFALSCILTLCVLSISAVGAPPGVVRWDTYHHPYQASGPVPPVHTLEVPLSSPTEIGVDEFGRLYVYDLVRQCIDRFTPTGELDKVWLEDTGPGRINSGFHELEVLTGERILLSTAFWPGYTLKFGPDPLAVDRLPGIESPKGFATWEDGSYLIYERTEGRAHVYSAKGDPQGSWDLPTPLSMAVGPDGFLYVVTDPQAEVVVYDRKGVRVRAIDVKPAFTDLGAGYTTEASIALDRNGDIYLSDRMYIVRLDRDGKPLARWLAAENRQPPFPTASVYELAVRNGLIYALVDQFMPTTEIQAFTADGQCIARYQPPKLPLDLPAAIAVQADGSYAVHQASPIKMGQDLIFDASGKEIGDLGDEGWGVVACPTGGYYNSDWRSIRRMDADGKNATVVFKAADESTRVFQMCVDQGTGRIFVLCDGTKLLTISPEGELLNEVQLSEAAGADFLNYMALDSTGFVYFTNTGGHEVRKFRLDGTYVGAVGKLGSGLGELRRPRGIIVDSEGRLLVCDARNNRIQVFSREGEPLGVWGTYGRGDGELDRPNDLTIGPNNTLYIADTHNDRIVKVPLADFWKQLTKEIKAPPAYIAAEKVPMPKPGEVTVEGIVVAGTDDFTDCVYIQAADRSWGTRVTMPVNVPANRGERIKVTGTLELKEHAAKHVKASKSEFVVSVQSMPSPLGMANLYVGDGYRMGARPSDLSNLGLLIKSWGRVLMADPLNKRFVISDGSRLGSAPGLEVYGGQLKAPLTLWPKVGQYVMVTGISAVRPVGDGTFHPAIRLRAQEDLQVLVEN